MRLTALALAACFALMWSTACSRNADNMSCESDSDCADFEVCVRHDCARPCRPEYCGTECVVDEESGHTYCPAPVSGGDPNNNKAEPTDMDAGTADLV